MKATRTASSGLLSVRFLLRFTDRHRPPRSFSAATQVLAQRRIVSAPVFDDTTGEYFGFLSSSNAVNAFLAGASTFVPRRCLRLLASRSLLLVCGA